MRSVLLLMLVIVTALPASGAEEAVTLPNPLRQVKEGQWVKFKMSTMFGEAEQTQSITAIQGEGDDRVITIKTEISVDGEIVDTDEVRMTYQSALEEQRAALEDTADLRLSAATARLNGREIDAVKAEFTQDDTRCTVILTEEVPITGVIRIDMEGMDGPAVELIDFGDQ